MAEIVRVRVRLVGFALLLVLVVGCEAQNGQPDGQDALKRQQATEPTPSDELPKIPKVATKKTHKGAAVFAKHYYALINYGRATDDWKPAKDVTLPSCKQCEDFWADKPSRMDNNRRIAHLRTPGVGRFDDPKTAVALRITTDIDPDDIPMKPGHEWSDLLWLDYRDGQWMVEELEVDELWSTSSE